MADKTLKLNGLVQVTLTKRQAEWLYDLLTEHADERSSWSFGDQNCTDISDKLDVELGKI